MLTWTIIRQFKIVEIVMKISFFDDIEVTKDDRLNQNDEDEKGEVKSMSFLFRIGFEKWRNRIRSEEKIIFLQIEDIDVVSIYLLMDKTRQEGGQDYVNRMFKSVVHRDRIHMLDHCDKKKSFLFLIRSSDLHWYESCSIVLKMKKIK